MSIHLAFGNAFGPTCTPAVVFSLLELSVVQHLSRLQHRKRVMCPLISLNMQMNY